MIEPTSDWDNFHAKEQMHRTQVFHCKFGLEIKKEIINSFKMRACNQNVIKIDENIVDEIRFAKNGQRGVRAQANETKFQITDP
jgi:hypothetical protein